jgi:glycerol-3-phosphate dehydrogenase
MSQDYDVLIIGGGITGAAAARDCALRGFKTLLLEKKDFSAGTTGACMGMLHGGLQYAVSEPELTEQSCIESGIFQRQAPHLVFRIPFLHVYFEGGPAELTRYLPSIEKYDGLAPHKNSYTHVALDRADTLLLEPSLSPRVQGSMTMDEPGISPFRLVMANLIQAEEHGAVIRNHAQVIEILRDGTRVYGVRVRDGLTGEEQVYRADLVANCSGPWTPKVAEMAGVPVELLPIKGIHVIFDRRITSTAVHIEGATMLPHENTTIAGIINEYLFIDPEEMRPSRNEVVTLLTRLEKAIPGIRQTRVVRAMAGARPTLRDETAKDSRAVSRHHQVFDHAELDGLQGFVSIAGGKMVVARQMAEDLVDVICRKLGHQVSCRTADLPLPGGERSVDPDEIAEIYGIPLHTAARIVYRYGARAEQVLEVLSEKPHYRSNLCVCEPVTAAEVDYTVRCEWARTLDDVRRRTRLGMGPCQGSHCTGAAAGFIAGASSASTAHAHADLLEFLQSRWRGRVPVLEGEQLRQEELQRAVYLGLGGYHDPNLGRMKNG